MASTDDPDPFADLSDEDADALLDRVIQRASERDDIDEDGLLARIASQKTSRREALAGLAGGALLGGGAASQLVEPAAAGTQQSGTVGSSSNPVDVHAEDSFVDQQHYNGEVGAIVHKLSGGTIVADGPNGEIDSGTDAATVIQSAVDNVPDGGDVFIKSGEYTIESTIVNSQRSCELVGEGMPWTTNDGTFGTTLRAGTGVENNAVYQAAAQFSGARQIHVHGDDLANPVIDLNASTDNRDFVLRQFGVQSGKNYNIYAQGDNTWIWGPAWNEFAGYAGLRVTGAQDVWYNGIMTARNGEKEIEIGAATDNLWITNCRFTNTAAGLHAPNAVEFLSYEGNHHRGIGYESSTAASDNHCLHVGANVTNGTVTGNTVDATSPASAAAETANFLVVESTASVDNLRTANNVHTGLTGAPVVDNGQTGYKAPAARAYLSANQSLSAGTWATIAFDTTSEDTRGEFDTTNNKYVASEPGRYLISGQVVFGSPAAGDDVYARVNRNTTQIIYKQTYTNGASENLEFADVQPLAAGDEITVDALNNSSSDSLTSASKHTFLAVQRIDSI